MDDLDPGNPIPWLRQLFATAVAAVQADGCLPAHLPQPPRERTFVVGAGKASAAMAQTLEAHWPTTLSGLVVTRYGHGAPCRHIDVLEAAHPVPDAVGVQAAQRMLAAVAELGTDDLVLALISGGGSALLALPAPGITLADQQQLSRALLHSGAPIRDINIVRSHLSAIKGGRLARAAGKTRVATLVISDVPDDDPAWVASGPTIANHSTGRDALAILRRHDIRIAGHLHRVLEQSQPTANGVRRLDDSVAVVATAADALAAAKQAAVDANMAVHMLGDALQGEARELGRQHGQLARRVQADGLTRPALLLSGGETSVTVNASDCGGQGGRNTEYLLALTLALDGASGIYALAADTDGIDGTQDDAGAVISQDTLARAQTLGLDARQALDKHDSHGFFSALDALVTTGPTRTNVNDFRAILVQPRDEAVHAAPTANLEDGS